MKVNPVNVIRLLLATFQAMQISESPVIKGEIELADKIEKILVASMKEINAVETIDEETLDFQESFKNYEIHAVQDKIWCKDDKYDDACSEDKEELHLDYKTKAVEYWRSVIETMKRWNGKVAVVTGASSGIGLATAKALVQQGLTVVGLARREAKMDNNMKNVKGPGKFYAKQCDITKEESVIESLNWVKNTFGSLNILINSAGTVILESNIEDTPTAELENVINVNVMGLLYCSKQAIKLMKENQKEAHIVNINDAIAGHIVPTIPGLNVYPATKFAVTALTQILRTELLETKIRITSVSPGATKTPMADKAKEYNSTLALMPLLEVKDVVNSVFYVLGAPPHVEINELIIQARSK